ncbi:hypothetical protein ACFW9D_32755 [Streptomyces sp. NPDC059524]|uniref:hypothetical protein n=1 Tax=Streptomyces sp. NPDC059524 TaxID=3346856 RepID=UPI00368520B1
MSSRGPAGGGDIEDTWRKPWWIVVGAAVMFAIAWATVDSWIDPYAVELPDDCVRGPRGGCLVDAPYHWAASVTFFVLGLPAVVVAIMGLVTDRWPPALGLALGSIAGGIFTLTHGDTTAHVIWAVVLFALAATSLVLVTGRKIRRPRRRSRESWLSP